MPTVISVNKQSVSELLNSGRAKPFVIPEYQRPYAWTQEQIETLFEDIWEFATTKGGTKRKGSYFLGSIVSFENEAGEQEIIDGQQRITSLFLLLRAIYTKLEKSSATDANQNFMRQIEPAIWRTDNMTGKVDFSDILLVSRVVDNEGNNVLRDILQTGAANSELEDNYSKNYILFQKLYDSRCMGDPGMASYDFIYALLNQAILLPISADNQDTALTIFSTLNDRGLPLSDSDIFKAKIYNHLGEAGKPAFIDEWKSLEKEASEAGESIQQLFYYYMFYLRAKEGDVSSSTPGLRKYYAGMDNQFSRLYASSLMADLKTVLNLWRVINTNQDIVGETWDNNPQIRKALDILTSYPNEFWKYPVIIYYLVYREDTGFEERFLLFLRKLIVELASKFLLFPTINVVKSDIMKLNARIVESPHPEFTFRPVDMDALPPKIKVPHRNIVRMLLKMYAYGHQEKLLPDNWQIEHILPQHWQSSFFPGIEDSVIDEELEHIGNKTPFERKLNIIASNGYFRKKQSEYRKSAIEVTRSLALNAEDDWRLENIGLRDDMMATELMAVMQDWNRAYSTPVKRQVQMPSPEELAMIEKFKQNGWV